MQIETIKYSTAVMIRFTVKPKIYFRWLLYKYVNTHHLIKHGLSIVFNFQNVRHVRAYKHGLLSRGSMIK